MKNYQNVSNKYQKLKISKISNIFLKKLFPSVV